MKRFIEGEDRGQVALLPECLDDYITEDNPVRVVDAFVDELDLEELGFEGAEPAETGRPSYHPSMLLEAIHIGTTLYDLSSHLNPEAAADPYAADHAPGYPGVDE